MEKHSYKMYSIVLRQLSGINNGIQTAHGVCEYVRKHWDDADLQEWINVDKTLVVLNGGTVQNIEAICQKFNENNIKYEVFREIDLGNLVTSVCVLADERVWDRKNYLDFDEYLLGDLHETNESLYLEYIGGKENMVKKEVLNNLRTI